MDSIKSDGLYWNPDPRIDADPLVTGEELKAFQAACGHTWKCSKCAATPPTTPSDAAMRAAALQAARDVCMHCGGRATAFFSSVGGPNEAGNFTHQHRTDKEAQALCRASAIYTRLAAATTSPTLSDLRSRCCKALFEIDDQRIVCAECGSGCGYIELPTAPVGAAGDDEEEGGNSLLWDERRRLAEKDARRKDRK